MKKLLITTFLLMFCYVNSQNFSCGTKGFIPINSDSNRPSIPDPVDPDSTMPYVLNAFFTLIKDGNGDTIIDNWEGNQLATNEQIENKFLECIKILNIQYNQYNIYFKYVGFRTEDTSDINVQSFQGSENNWSALSAFKEPNAMNFYFINSTSGTSSYSLIGGVDSVYSLVNLHTQNYGFLYYALTHEVAHNLSLYHTYEEGSHFDPNTQPDLFLATQCERINRIPNGNPQIYNADIAGDEVIDTEAQPQLFLFNNSCQSFTVDPNILNCYLEPYSTITTGNFMNHSVYIDQCWNFTQGQIARMRNYIRNNTTNYSYLLGLDSARTDVAELYEPFDAQIIDGEVISTTDQPDNGGAIVCRRQNYRLRFQPGFNQIFHDVNNGPISQTSEQQFNYDNSFDHAIGVEIPSISNQIRGGIGVVSSILGSSCNFESYVSGTVYSMAVLGSMNITVKELNEIEVKDPELYDKLMEQYYYIMKKITTSGAKTEQTFFKN